MILTLLKTHVIGRVKVIIRALIKYKTFLYKYGEFFYLISTKTANQYFIK